MKYEFQPTLAILIAVSAAFTAPRSSFAKRPECPAPQEIMPQLMSPQGIQGWLRTVGTRVKSVREFVCCLPEEYRSNYLVAHSSVAGQPGTPANPRVLMVNKVGEGSPLNMTLTINGDDHVEMLFRNPRSGEAEYYDLPFGEKQSPSVSGKNPETCMNCHGVAGKAPYGGPRPIFAAAVHWPRFVGAALPCNRVEDELQKMASAEAVRSLREKPNYECLDKTKLTGAPRSGVALAQDFDSALDEINNRRIARLVRAEKNYEKYKYALVGSTYCPGVTFEEWFPPEVLRNAWNNLRVNPALRGGGDLSEGFRRALARIASEDGGDRRALAKLISDPARVKREGFTPLESVLACQDRQKSAGLLERQLNLNKDSARDLFKVLEADSVLKASPVNRGIDPYLRLFVEGQGLAIENWQRRPSDSAERDHATLRVLDLQLLEKEPPDSDLGILFDRSERFPAKNPGMLCARLKELSRKAFTESQIEKTLKGPAPRVDR